MEIISIIIAILAAAILLGTVAGMWKVFEKAGENGWASLIPIYNNYIMLKIGGHSPWWVVVYILPVLPSLLSFFLGVAQAQTTSPSLPAGFGGYPPESQGLEALLASGAGIELLIAGALFVVVFFAILQLVILVNVITHYDVARSFGKSMLFTFGLIILPFVFWPILGFGSAKYRGPTAHPKTVDVDGKPKSNQDHTAASEMA